MFTLVYHLCITERHSCDFVNSCSLKHHKAPWTLPRKSWCILGVGALHKTPSIPQKTPTLKPLRASGVPDVSSWFHLWGKKQKGCTVEYCTGKRELCGKSMVLNVWKDRNYLLFFCELCATNSVQELSYPNHLFLLANVKNTVTLLTYIMLHFCSKIWYWIFN